MGGGGFDSREEARVSAIDNAEWGVLGAVSRRCIDG